jgi:uncharacterized protein YukE
MKREFKVLEDSWDSKTRIAFKNIFGQITKEMDKLMCELELQGLNIKKYSNDIKSTEERYSNKLR